MQNTSSHMPETCYHCGEPCVAGSVHVEGHAFCCIGCKTVYEIIENNGLCQYYSLEDHAGLHPQAESNGTKWVFLNDPEIAKKLLDFQSDALAIITFKIPGMHCSSCIYLLENLSKIAQGVQASEVNFLKKEVTIKYNPSEISLGRIAEVLTTIGYAPVISLQDMENKVPVNYNRNVYYKIGIAGFCFGNIMILSLPEYFDFKNLLSSDFIHLFRYLNLLLILPVLFYCALDYFRSSWYAIKNLRTNMDFAISLGIGGLAVQSFYDVLSGKGAGYFDSMSGLVFFLLIGKFIQQRTFESLSFNRDYKSYFPLSITRLAGNAEYIVNVNELQTGDIIKVHHQELIPADSILETKNALIDYAFVTGESQPVHCIKGELIYAGGRNTGTNLKLGVVKNVSQSYLTRLWNDKAFDKAKETGLSLWATQLANGFTIAVITIATITGIYWKIHNPAVALQAITSVLIVACPCVLALAIPFTFGQIMCIMGQNGLYLKNSQSIEKLASIQAIVFDKTGTLTQPGQVAITESGELSENEKNWVAEVASNSMHPVSRGLGNNMPRAYDSPITNWQETIGQGISASVRGNDIKIGSLNYINAPTASFMDDPEPGEGNTYFTVNGKVKGNLSLALELRNDIKELAESLGRRFNLYILSGDNDKQRKDLEKYFNPQNLFFKQSPKDKLDFIKSLQNKGKRVMMIGDGLNDSGALMASDFGITVTDDINSFTPASDAILDISKLGFLSAFAGLARDTKRIVYGALFFSIAYNLIGLSFAVRGQLHPWVAAILMPISSITVVLYTRFATMAAAKRNNL